jgi:hypothetical protein
MVVKGCDGDKKARLRANPRLTLFRQVGCQLPLIVASAFVTEPLVAAESGS